jgi:hypothetical protein
MVLGLLCPLLLGIAGARANPPGASPIPNNQAANNGAAAAAALEEQHRIEQSAQLVSRIGLDPTHIRTIGIWPGKGVPCKLPKREEPYVCRALIQGPALILNRLPFELFAARGDQAAARGERSWWRHGFLEVMPVAVAPGETLYVVGDLPALVGDGDLVFTVWRP